VYRASSACGDSSFILTLAIMLVFDHRSPVVKDIYVRLILSMAYFEANTVQRHNYALTFHDLAEQSDTPANPNQVKAADLVESLLGPKSAISQESAMNDEDKFGYRFDVSLLFPPHAELKSYSWERVESFPTLQYPDTLYLNPALLDAYEVARKGRDRVRLLVIMYCAVLHELAHFLHFKIYNTADQYFQGTDHGTSDPHVEYGTELEYRIFGGRILTKADYTALRLQCRNGDVYDLPAGYLYKEYVESARHKLELERLQKLEAGLDDADQWMGMGQINGTHD
jgi:hypothetical protein